MEAVVEVNSAFDLRFTKRSERAYANCAARVGEPDLDTWREALRFRLFVLHFGYGAAFNAAESGHATPRRKKLNCC